jgi:hypothetical protein
LRAAGSPAPAGAGRCSRAVQAVRSSLLAGGGADVRWDDLAVAGERLEAAPTFSEPVRLLVSDSDAGAMPLAEELADVVGGASFTIVRADEVVLRSLEEAAAARVFSEQPRLPSKFLSAKLSGKLSSAKRDPSLHPRDDAPPPFRARPPSPPSSPGRGSSSPQPASPPPMRQPAVLRPVATLLRRVPASRSRSKLPEDGAMPLPTHALLYLRDGTFDDGGATAAMVRAALGAGVPLVLVQELAVERGAVEFRRFYEVSSRTPPLRASRLRRVTQRNLPCQTTPADLLEARLFDSIAQPLYSCDEHRALCLKNIAKAMGALAVLISTSRMQRLRQVMKQVGERASAMSSHHSRTGTSQTQLLSPRAETCRNV